MSMFVAGTWNQVAGTAYVLRTLTVVAANTHPQSKKSALVCVMQDTNSHDVARTCSAHDPSQPKPGHAKNKPMLSDMKRDKSVALRRASFVVAHEGVADAEVAYDYSAAAEQSRMAESGIRMEKGVHPYRILLSDVVKRLRNTKTRVQAQLSGVKPDDSEDWCAPRWRPCADAPVLHHRSSGSLRSDRTKAASAPVMHACTRVLAPAQPLPR
jgi:hypothetical protein